jgi:hypothetical protein
MIIIPTEIKLSVKFLTIDANIESVVETNDFSLDFQKIDKTLFLEAYEALEKIKQELIEKSKKLNQS